MIKFSYLILVYLINRFQHFKHCKMVHLQNKVFFWEQTRYSRAKSKAFKLDHFTCLYYQILGDMMLKDIKEPTLCIIFLSPFGCVKHLILWGYGAVWHPVVTTYSSFDFVGAKWFLLTLCLKYPLLVLHSMFG